jgi:hypothetical protein
MYIGAWINKTWYHGSLCWNLAFAFGVMCSVGHSSNIQSLQKNMYVSNGSKHSVYVNDKIFWMC